ncbi:MAG TPA: metallopeptidase [Pirellulales bacterium]|nr:metallopeptidase [Pirellulales bacterium]
MATFEWFSLGTIAHRRWFILAATVAALTAAEGKPALAQKTSAEATPMTTDAAAGAYDPTDQYNIETIEGWTVRLNRAFRDKEPKLCQDTLAVLRFQLYQITRNVPDQSVAKLRQITIWVEEAEPHHPCMAYHPDASWLREHGMNPDKARCVELANARNFLKWTHEQPWMVFHELAHGYHHQFLDRGFDNAELRAAFERAKESKSYENVLRASGRRERHYALTNPQEYFAEASEAYFGTNDFYPYVRAELREHDPDGCDLLTRLWAVE